ncbi:MAG: SEL1-like repeat protein, partial [Gammaproteobacteria bacterium]|nr:SEL1-like repeat protein [Gammaproteobacteria bacterium]
MRSILVALIISTALVSTSWANLEQGTAAYNRGDYSAAFAAFKSAAKGGNVEAKYRMGLLYLNGQGTPQNYPAAVKALEEAAERGHHEAQYQTARLYDMGRGVRAKNPLTAYKWFQKAADGGHPGAQYQMAIRFADGREVPQNYEKAFEWYLKAAEQGHMIAEFEVGQFYDLGLEEALCTRAKSPAQCRKRALKHAQGKDNAVLAFEWVMRAADQGYAAAQYKIGELYEQGRGVHKDAGAAAMWFTLAAEQGLVEAKFKADLYKKSTQTERKEVLDRRARAADIREAEKGSADAQLMVAKMYDNGVGVPKNFVKAYMWYNLAAAQGLTEAGDGRDKLELRMTSRQISDAQRLSQEMIEKIAANASAN